MTGCKGYDLWGSDAMTGAHQGGQYAGENPEAACRRALEQIREKGYAQGMRSEGIQTILKYGIACCRKACRVLMERDG